ncbi:response regulator [Rudanella paleaurantiibacter]|uniref:Response regulator n=1 Tax=Rudanella paleaurantiibacter TaxID=2614655 RepID=A0A7J5TW63_9BACT|nr:response regulator [Rudanella paleaurantiibacter]KAB7728686.1 response regulator [Rudanella paleaurantiibacter]
MLSPSSQSPNVWLVDDDQDDQFLVYTAFEQHTPSIPLKILNDGDEVLPELSNAPEPPRLILLDINMPRQNGFETLAQVRRTVAWQDLPIILFTTSSTEGDQERAQALGATHFLTKPTDYGQLQVMISQLVKHYLPSNALPS